MQVNDSQNVKLSLLKGFGLLIKKQHIESASRAIFTKAKEDLKKELAEKFDIQDLINPEKSREILSLYLRYFNLPKAEGGGGRLKIINSNFLEVSNLNNDYIKEHVEELRVNFAEMSDSFDFSSLTDKEISKAFMVGCFHFIFDKYKDYYKISLKIREFMNELNSFYDISYEPVIINKNNNNLCKNKDIHNNLFFYLNLKEINFFNEEFRQNFYKTIKEYKNINFKCFNSIKFDSNLDNFVNFIEVEMFNTAEDKIVYP